MTKRNDAVEYQALKAKLLAMNLGERTERVIMGRVAVLVADGQSHTGAIKRATMEKKVSLR